MTAFFRFPHTPHLAWLGEGQPRADKVFSPAEARDHLDGEVIVEEKVDGANLGFSIDDEGHLRAQNRGKYLDLGALSGQWKPLGRWLEPHRDAMLATLVPGLILFGEWCYAVHSIRYTRLPDWFLAYDVYDVGKAEFWSVARRNALAAKLDLVTVPALGRGRFDLPRLCAMLTRSRLTDSPAEGLYVRKEADDRLVGRAKVVRAEFVQAIEEHWSGRPIEVNRLAGDAGTGPTSST